MDYLKLIDNELPREFKLNQNYPNPFNPITEISYELANDGFVKLSIFDMKGREIKILIENIQLPGKNSVIWNATDNNGQPVSAGLYLYKIKYKGITKTRKMVLIK